MPCAAHAVILKASSDAVNFRRFSKGQESPLPGQGWVKQGLKRTAPDDTFPGRLCMFWSKAPQNFKDCKCGGLSNGF